MTFGRSQSALSVGSCSLAQCPHERRLVDNAAAANVDENRVRLQQLERTRVEHPGGLVGQRQRDHERVDPGEQSVQALRRMGLVDVRRVARAAAVDRERSHSEGLGEARDLGADRIEPEYEQGAPA
jgi:hypothetical protein